MQDTETTRSSQRGHGNSQKSAERAIIAQAGQNLQNGRPLTIITASGDRARQLRSILRRNSIPSGGHDQTENSETGNIRVISIRWAAGMPRPEGDLIVDLHNSRKSASRRQAATMYGDDAILLLGQVGSSSGPAADRRPDATETADGRAADGTCLQQRRGQGRPTHRRSVRVEHLP